MDVMEIASMIAIDKSNRLKRKVCDSCMDQFKGVLSDEEMKEFGEAFYQAVNGMVFKEKI